MLSGGLDPENVAEAIAVDATERRRRVVGRGSRPGVKDPDRIEAFVKAARAAFAVPAF